MAAADDVETPLPRGRVFTVGHSTHDLAELVRLLRTAGVTAVADVRAHPGSRRLPHFSRASLERELPSAGLEYRHLPDLGGRRRPHPDSPNGGWRVAAFRGYADHMASAAFAEGLRELEALAARRPTAVMCAEALWWRCHRRLVADALVVRGWKVVHVSPDGRTDAHELTDLAVVDGPRVTYPAAQTSLDAAG